MDNQQSELPAPAASSHVPGSDPAEEGRLQKPAYLRRLAFLILAYSAAIVLGHWVGYLVRFEFNPPLEHQAHFRMLIQWILPLQLVALWAFGQFRTLLSYFSLPDLRSIVLACGFVALVLLAAWYYTDGLYAPPRSIILLGFLLDIVALGCVRLGFRSLREWQTGSSKASAPLRRVVIIGAGDVGANLAREMKSRRDLRMTPVGFLDDAPPKWGSFLHGVPVIGRPELLLKGKIRADAAILAMPSATGRRVREVVQILNEARVRFETVPSLEQMMTGAVRVSQIRPVQIEDLLGRDHVSLEPKQIRNLIFDKVVLVTGAGGSIGSELCRQIASHAPLRLLLVERCEAQIFQIEQELLGAGHGATVIPLVADIRDQERMRAIFERFKPQVVFHAAAHKHVPLMEHQPFEAFQNNSIGTMRLALLAAEMAVERFVLISTDKAINPTNTMGACKRLAEIFIQALHREKGATTKFMAVRFGNVLGSSGSVIPTFRKQIAEGGPVTVTHPDITRYFMTVAEAVALVLQSATQGQGGEIFVLDMGKPVRIADLAHQMVELSGLRPGIDIEIRFTGLRPGEKLFEELNHATENTVPTDHAKIMRFVGEPPPLEKIHQGLLALEAVAGAMDANQVKLEIQKLVPEYRPYLTPV
jgi:FlaA1/EpsC-like NDP-sugar epimerase